MSTQPMPMVQVFAPDGTLGDIPYDRLHDALGAGAKIAAKVKAPDGTVGFIPGDRVAEAMKAGASRIPLDLNDADGGKPGFWSNVGSASKNAINSLLGSNGPAVGTEAMGQGISTAGQMAADDIARQQEGRGLPYRIAAPIAQTIVPGLNPRAMEQAANRGDTAGVLGQAVVPAAIAISGAAAPYAVNSISDSVANVRTNARDALYTPEGKPTPLAKAISHPVDAAADYALRKVTGAPDVEVKGSSVPIRQSPYFSSPEYNAGRKGVASVQSVPLSDLVGKTPSGTVFVPEPRPPFEGETEGYMGSVPRETLPDLALSGKPGAAKQLQQLGNRVLYLPSGADFESAPRSTVRLSDLVPAQEPNLIYRAHTVGEPEVDLGKPAHATASEAEAQMYAQHRNQGEGQTVSAIDLNNFQPHEYEVSEGPRGNKWYKFKRQLTEDDYE